MHNCIRLSNPIVNVKIETTAVETLLGLGYVNYSPNILHLRHKSGNNFSAVKIYFQILVLLRYEAKLFLVKFKTATLHLFFEI